jgi:hypothetical protein
MLTLALTSSAWLLAGLGLRGGGLALCWLGAVVVTAVFLAPTEVFTGPGVQLGLVAVPVPGAAWSEAQVAGRVESERDKLEVAIAVATVSVVAVPQVEASAGGGSELASGMGKEAIAVATEVFRGAGCCARGLCRCTWTRGHRRQRGQSSGRRCRTRRCRTGRCAARCRGERPSQSRCDRARGSGRQGGFLCGGCSCGQSRR